MYIKKIDNKYKFKEIFSLLKKHQEKILILDSSLQNQTLGKYSFYVLNYELELDFNVGQGTSINNINSDIYGYNLFDNMLKETSENLQGAGQKGIRTKDHVLSIIEGILRVKRDNLKNKGTAEEYIYLNKMSEEEKIQVEKIPFKEGFVGYMDYEMGLDLNNIPYVGTKKLGYNNGSFVYCTELLVEDHENQSLIYIGSDTSKNKKTVTQKILTYEEELKKIYVDIRFQEKCEKKSPLFLETLENETKEEYLKKIKTVQDYIYDGDVYQINYTRQIKRIINKIKNEEKNGVNNQKLIDGDLEKIYERLRVVNKSPFGAYMKFPGLGILSSSPERLVKVENGIIETRPIKGTIKRASNQEEDEKNKFKLRNSQKDKAELLMIVDLERNDLGRVCTIGSVSVPEMYKIETYESVHHLVSTVRGQLKEDVSLLEIFKSIYPGGSITGAPKRRAMEIIEELENFSRNIYTGSLGYFDLSGNWDFNILIRTIVNIGNEVIYNVGGGITWKSSDISEYEETLHKGSPIEKLLENYDG